MSWRDKVQAMRDGKYYQKCPNPLLPKPTKPSSVSFGSTPPAPFQEKKGILGFPASRADFPESLKRPVMTVAANDPAQAVGLVAELPDRHCWPHSAAMTGREIDTFTARLGRFTTKGMTHTDGEALADKLVARDRESDDRRLCLECLHLTGYAGASWRCGNWQRAGVASTARDSGLPGDLVRTLQRCDGFKDQFQNNFKDSR